MKEFVAEGKLEHIVFTFAADGEVALGNDVHADEIGMFYMINHLKVTLINI